MGDSMQAIAACVVHHQSYCFVTVVILMRSRVCFCCCSGSYSEKQKRCYIPHWQALEGASGWLPALKHTILDRPALWRSIFEVRGRPRNLCRPLCLFLQDLHLQG